MNDIIRRASFSRCGQYRYSLSRYWNEQRPGLLYIGLNPSTADARHDDPTIRRCTNLADSWGYGAFTIANLFSFRATIPAELKQAADPVGPATDRVLKRLASNADTIVLMWGNHGAFKNRDIAVLRKFTDRNLYCVGRTRSGAPKHLLYSPRDARLINYDDAAPANG